MDGNPYAQPRPSTGLHQAVRGGRRLPSNHRVNLLANFSFLVVCRNRILGEVTVPERKDNREQQTGGRILRRVLGSHTPLGSPREVRDNTIHHIETMPDPPISCRPRYLPSDRLPIAKAEFDAMLRDDTTRSSHGPWSSVQNLVPKNDNG